jgi:hypothetical protein
MAISRRNRSRPDCGRDLRANDFDRDVPIVFDVAREIDDCHPTLTDHFAHAIPCGERLRKASLLVI